MGESLARFSLDSDHTTLLSFRKLCLTITSLPIYHTFSFRLQRSEMEKSSDILRVVIKKPVKSESWLNRRQCLVRRLDSVIKHICLFENYA